METKIKLIMNANKNIDIEIDDEVKYTIMENRREITAKEIYDIINYKKGYTYIITKDNSAGIDKPVIDYFFELFDDIIKRIGELNSENSDA